MGRSVKNEPQLFLACVIAFCALLRSTIVEKSKLKVGYVQLEAKVEVGFNVDGVGEAVIVGVTTDEAGSITAP